MTLSELRRKQGVRDMDLAYRLGIHLHTLRLWQIGRYQPRNRYLKPMAEILGVTVDEVNSAIEESRKYREARMSAI